MNWDIVKLEILTTIDLKRRSAEYAKLSHTRSSTYRDYAMINQTVRGTKDLLFDEWYRFKYLEQTANRISRLYGFLSVQTPIFEYPEVTTKTLGDSSDIITKEMYTFIDEGGKSITLRPEFTAAIVRLLIEKNCKHQ